MSGRRHTRDPKKEETMPKNQEKGSSVAKTNASSLEARNASSNMEDATGAATKVNSNDIMTAIKELKSDVTKGNDSLRQEINSLAQELNGKLDHFGREMLSLSGRVGEAETRVGRLEDWAAEVNAVLSASIKQQKTLQAKVTDLESRSRRNNIRVFGVAEGEEGSSVSQFITTLLKRELPLPQSVDLKIQRAHCSLAQKPRPEDPPRPIIINFQEFTTKELVLPEAWKRGKILLKDRPIYFDQDYAAEIVKKRKEYNGIKKALRERGIRFQTPYTSMRIHWDSGVRTYSSREGATVDSGVSAFGASGMGAESRQSGE